MLLATDADRKTVRASPGARALCPECSQLVIAKCGQIVIWHWAHLKLNPDCSNQGETEWHLGWKARAHDNGCLVEHKLVGGFRADIVTPRGKVIELQTKALDPDVASAREAAYGSSLVWIFQVDEDEPGDKIHWTKHLDNGGRGFHWRRGPKRLMFCRRPIILDIAGSLWEVKKINLIDHTNETYGSSSKRMLGWAMPTHIDTILEIEQTLAELSGKIGLEHAHKVREQMVKFGIPPHPSRVEVWEKNGWTLPCPDSHGQAAISGQADYPLD